MHNAQLPCGSTFHAQPIVNCALYIVHYDYDSSIRYFSIVHCSLIRKNNKLHFDKFLVFLLTKRYFQIPVSSVQSGSFLAMKSRLRYWQKHKKTENRSKSYGIATVFRCNMYAFTLSLGSFYIVIRHLLQCNMIHITMTGKCLKN